MEGRGDLGNHYGHGPWLDRPLPQAPTRLPFAVCRPRAPDPPTAVWPTAFHRDIYGRQLGQRKTPLSDNPDECHNGTPLCVEERIPRKSTPARLVESLYAYA